MSFGIAVRTKEGIVFAADRRGYMRSTSQHGSPRKSTSKVLRIQHNAGCVIAGAGYAYRGRFSTGVQANIKECMESHGEFSSPGILASTLAKTVFENYKKVFDGLDNKLVSSLYPSSNLLQMVVGMVTDEGIELWDVGMPLSIFRQKVRINPPKVVPLPTHGQFFMTTIGYSGILKELMEKKTRRLEKYRRRKVVRSLLERKGKQHGLDRTLLSEMIEFSRIAIGATEKEAPQSCGVGGGVDVATITHSQGFRRISL